VTAVSANQPIPASLSHWQIDTARAVVSRLYRSSRYHCRPAAHWDKPPTVQGRNPISPPKRRTRPARTPQAFPITTRERDWTGNASTMTGTDYIVTAVTTPRKRGAIRIIHDTGRDPHWSVGQLVELVNQATGLKLGSYEMTAGHTDTATIWDLI
jgi:hypothetical protein